MKIFTNDYKICHIFWTQKPQETAASCGLQVKLGIHTVKLWATNNDAVHNFPLTFLYFHCLIFPAHLSDK